MRFLFSAVFAFACLLTGETSAQVPQKLDDSRIAHILSTFRQIQVEGAKQARIKSKDRAVRAFVEALLAEQATANEYPLGQTRALKIEPVDNEVSRSLRERAAERRAELSRLDGVEFDKAYLAEEIAFQILIDGAVEITLLPTASDPALKTLMRNSLQTFQRREQRIRAISATLK